jgi:hypothetical protein
MMHTEPLGGPTDSSLGIPNIDNAKIVYNEVSNAIGDIRTLPEGSPLQTSEVFMGLADATLRVFVDSDEDATPAKLDVLAASFAQMMRDGLPAAIEEAEARRAYWNALFARTYDAGDMPGDAAC